MILCAKPTADRTGKCPAYKVRYERRVIGSGNGYCAGCWGRLVERERVLGENMRRRVEEMRMGRGVEEERESLFVVDGRGDGDVGRQRKEGEDGLRWILERERQRKENSEAFGKKNEKKCGREMKERKDTKRGWARKEEDPGFYIV